MVALQVPKLNRPAVVQVVAAAAKVRAEGEASLDPAAKAALAVLVAQGTQAVALTVKLLERVPPPQNGVNLFDEPCFACI